MTLKASDNVGADLAVGLDPNRRGNVTAPEGLTDIGSISAGHPEPPVCGSLEPFPSTWHQGSLCQDSLRVVSSGPWVKNEGGWLGVCLSDLRRDQDPVTK